jgi:putative holliday junction resolvase
VIDGTTTRPSRPSQADPKVARTSLLGIDLGEARIGLAVGHLPSGRVTPLATLRRGSLERDATTIARICDEQGVSAVVVGLPLGLDGSEGAQATLTRDWASRLGDLLGLPLRLRDERLTSEAALARMGRPPRGRAGGPPSRRSREAWRARIDREAAAAIVQAEMDDLR